MTAPWSTRPSAATDRSSRTVAVPMASVTWRSFSVSACHWRQRVTDARASTGRDLAQIVGGQFAQRFAAQRRQSEGGVNLQARRVSHWFSWWAYTMPVLLVVPDVHAAETRPPAMWRRSSVVSSRSDSRRSASRRGATGVSAGAPGAGVVFIVSLRCARGPG
jgi:hypothetical protein